MTTATDMLQKYIDAEAAVLLGQQVRFGERYLSRADLAEIRKGRIEWEQKVAAETARAAGTPSRAPIRFTL